MALRRSNLSHPLTSFIGRERELAALMELLTTARLATLTGPGGSGKTRLALEVGRQLVDDFPDGVWLVELADVSDPLILPRVLASVLNVYEQPNRTLMETLTDYLANKHMLLVLDNCEHLITACTDLVLALVHSCPQLRILTTSRQALNLAGEAVWLVSPLAFPDPEHIPSLKDINEFAAIRLFIDRARDWSPGFGLTESGMAATARVCQRLDGIPLALELAAPHVRMLTIEHIADRLDDAFSLLRRSGTSRIPRHQTLAATINWSHDLLSQRESALFRRLSAFAGGFTLAAAEFVGAEPSSVSPASRASIYPVPNGPPLGEETFYLLESLVDKSLVQVNERKEGGEERYRLLEIVRQYAAARLQAAGETELVRTRHLEWYLWYAERAEPELKGYQQADWLGLLKTEHHNLRSALAWSQRPEVDSEIGTRLIAALSWYWWVRGHYSEAKVWTERVLARRDSQPSRAMAQVLAWAGNLLAGQQGSLVRAMSFLEQSLAMSRQLDDKASLAWALVMLARVTEQQGDAERAVAWAEEGVVVSRQLREPWYVALALERLGEAVRLSGDYSRAAALYAESLDLSRAIGDRRNIAVLLHNLGHVRLHEGDLRAAAELFAESLLLAEEMEDQRRIVMCLEGMAGVVARDGEFERSARLFGAAAQRRAALGADFEAADHLAYQLNVAPLQARQFERAWDEGRRLAANEAAHEALSEMRSLTTGTAQARSQGTPTASPSETARRQKLQYRQAFDGLTTRECQVAALVSRGRSNRGIAQELVVSKRTVDKHVGSILSKLGFRSRSQIAAWAVQKGLSERSEYDERTNVSPLQDASQ